MKYLLAACILFSGASFATSNQTGKITSLLTGPIYGDKLFFNVDGTINNKPSCHTNEHFDYVLDISTPSGQAYMSLIMTAYAADKTVTVTGYDKCSIYIGVSNFRSINTK
ncbi:hypothetical protein CWB99_22300 [Pseudoalteromonas rubra]|uniref:Uncharacterized protein n=1 Tax=Pseudoalteromonas rubra TaxID=43658 RepID=A0A5S3WFE5_9GAMM|nr:hypothetical protein [Pseudoalteromonas rubra]TMP24475.1 hypothetical protein CWB99_22300 [Pseudoalteromonas rubra]TMP33284.1 hypothetical protein CWC00_10940 [Pseudoalteromonas rubra]